jgi:hypothetical protein
MVGSDATHISVQESELLKRQIERRLAERCYSAGKPAGEVLYMRERPQDTVEQLQSLQ